MNELYTFIFDEEVIEKKLKPKWLKIYDPTYVETKIEELLKNKESLNDLSEFLLSKAKVGIFDKEEEDEKKDLNDTNDNNDNITKTATNLLSITQGNFNKKKTKVIEPLSRRKKHHPPIMQEPFNLTENKPRKFIEPTPIEINFKMKPLPLANYHKTSLKQIEEERNERLEKLRKRTLCEPFEFKTEKRPMNYDKIKEEVEKKLNDTLDFNKKYSIKIPDFNNKNADVKYNEAAIIREEFLIDKNKKEIEKEMNRRLIEKTDDKEFNRWVSEMKIKEDIENLEKIQKRKIALEMTRETTLTCKEKYQRINQLKNLEHKKELAENAIKKERKKQKELIKNKNLIIEINKGLDNIVQNKIKRTNENKELFKNIKDNINELTSKAIIEKKLELERRDEIVRQIRELEKLPMIRNTGFDPTETQGIGLLEEMSLVELKERLEIQKKMLKEQIESKREENKLKAEERTDEIIEKANIILDHRDKLRNLKEIERKEKKDAKIQKENLLREIREKNLFEMREKMQNKKDQLRKEDEIFQRKIRDIKLQRQFLQLGQAAVEEKVHKMIEEGLERKITNDQNQRLVDQQKAENVKWIDLNHKYKQAVNDVKKQKKLLSKYLSAYENSKNLHDLAFEQDKIFKKAIIDKENALRKYQLDDYKVRNKFSEKLNTLIKKKNNSTERIFGKTVTNGFGKKKNKNFGGATNPSLTYTGGDNLNSNLNIINESDDEEKNTILNKLENEEKKKELIAE